MLEWVFSYGEVLDQQKSDQEEPLDPLDQTFNFIFEGKHGDESFSYSEVQDPCLFSENEEERTTYMEPDVSNNGDYSGGGENMDHIQYWPLFKAIQENNWEGVEDFVTENPRVLDANIHVLVKETVFHIITRKLDFPFWLMEKLASKVDPETLARLTEEDSGSAIFWAAAFGNEKAAKAFVRRNNNLPNIPNSEDLLPIHEAAACGHEKVIRYLLTVTSIRLDDERGVTMLINLISSGLYGIAFDLMKRYPNLARESFDHRRRILASLSYKPLAFESGSRFGYWQQLIYRWTPIQEDDIPNLESVRGDMENPTERSNESTKFKHFGYLLQRIFRAFGAFSRKLHIVLWSVLVQLAPSIKCIRDTKLLHMQALGIVRMICHERVIWSNKEASETLCQPILTAARFGICELVREILKAYFYSYTFADENGHSIFHLAILHRQDKVFSLINKMDLFLWDWKAAPDMRKANDNVLHLVGNLVPASQVPGAALQMQRELQWFKAVESYVHPSLQEQRNSSKKTPREVFTEQHQTLVEKGEKWMKETSQSCTVVAALIITVVFAAAFTVPGGNNNDGIPNFLRNIPFMIFAVSDALAFFSSTASVLMFLAILASRYSEEDFLESLPKKLIIGLITLFFSIASMIVAFAATIYIVLSHPWKWVIIPIAGFGCLPISLFVWLQFPLLVEIFLSTYRPSIPLTTSNY